MQIKKHQINSIVIQHIHSCVFSISERSWKLVFTSREKNRVVTISPITDNSIDTNTYHLFVVDDNVYSLDEGVNTLDVFELKVVGNSVVDEKFYCRLVCVVVDNDKTYKKYTNTRDIKAYKR